MSRAVRYFADKVVDVLVYMFISSLIAGVSFSLTPTLTPAQVFFIVAFSALIGIVLVFLFGHYVRRRTRMEDDAIPQLVAYAKMGLRDSLKVNLKPMVQMFNDGSIPYRFKIWDETVPELKKQLVTQEEYDALDDFAKSLTQCPRRDEPNFDVMSALCKTNFERLKRLGFVS